MKFNFSEHKIVKDRHVKKPVAFDQKDLERAHQELKDAQDLKNSLMLVPDVDGKKVIAVIEKIKQAEKDIAGIDLFLKSQNKDLPN